VPLTFDADASAGAPLQYAQQPATRFSLTPK